jgi:hypothetical protein
MMYFNQIKKNLTTEQIAKLKFFCEVEEKGNFKLFTNDSIISEKSLIGSEISDYLHYSLSIDEDDIRSVLILQMNTEQTKQMKMYLESKKIQVELV